MMVQQCEMNKIYSLAFANYFIYAKYFLIIYPEQLFYVFSTMILR